jgi:hypothetical protein
VSNQEISSTPTSTMTPEAIRAEATQLRCRIAEVQSELAKRRAWAVVDHKEKDKTHLTWLANTRGLNGKLQVRYAVIRAAEKQLNAKQHRRTHAS